jgi:tryptophanyl-tRNA synthetase
MDTPLQLGLFSYPVLQAADVLVHQVTHVPVGEDQSQHLEFARQCASSFNHQYGDILIEPETILSPAKRIMSLTNPKKKMSKSDTNDKSRILLTDSREEIRKKIKAAVTDSEEGVTYDPDNRPEIANLINLLLHLENDDSLAPRDLIQDVTSKAALKDKLTDTIDAHLEPIRERYNELISPDESDYLFDVAEEGAEMARASAEETMQKVREAVGFGAV